VRGGKGVAPLNPLIRSKKRMRVETSSLEKKEKGGFPQAFSHFHEAVNKTKKKGRRTSIHRERGRGFKIRYSLRQCIEWEEGGKIILRYPSLKRKKGEQVRTHPHPEKGGGGGGLFNHSLEKKKGEVNFLYILL